MRIRASRAWTAVAVSLVAATALTSCTPKFHTAREPITRSVSTLQGRTVTLPLGTTLNITTGSVPVEDYNGVIDHPSIAIFITGARTSDGEFDPGVEPVKPGTTKVTMSDTKTGESVTFTVDVVSG